MKKSRKKTILPASPKSRLRFARTRDGQVIDQYGRIFTDAGPKGRFVGCGYATH